MPCLPVQDFHVLLLINDVISNVDVFPTESVILWAVVLMMFNLCLLPP